MATLKFRFDLGKLVNALAFFADAGVGGLTKLKAAKLLYLADQRHLFRFGRPITGDRYIAMDLGPVPESAFQLISSLADPEEAEDPGRRAAAERLSLRKGVLQKYAVVRAVQKPDLEVFSDSEIEVLQSIVKEFGKRKASELVDLTHGHAAYKRADAGRSPGSSVDLPYEYFFEDAPPGSDGARALAEEEHADRAFADALEAAGRLALTRQHSQATH
ncbi:MAG: Panacea domain-containing protein [Acidobacteriota bacterium]|nr:Panacea domain-containing protein [Acidobacteriota bacterium]